MEKYGHSTLLPAFHRFDEITIKPGLGDYILFHGNLAVAENSDVFLRIASNVLSKIPHRVMVAGKNPSKSFIRKTIRVVEYQGLLPIHRMKNWMNSLQMPR